MLSLTFILLPIIKNTYFQETCSKKYILMPPGARNFEMFLALLTKIVIF